MNNTVEENVHEPHPALYELFYQYLVEIFNFFKYIFNDVFIGLDP